MLTLVNIVNSQKLGRICFSTITPESGHETALFHEDSLI